ncbi:hypothetical protein ACFQJ7_16620 [Halovenus rubra]|uniref:Uncharacterized protein n=2 Tax=Halovenus rubra TaxID=869890 RepID=A0ACC7DW50_9EURY|nr:hypothetical protein [Halovenus rubra]
MTRRVERMVTSYRTELLIRRQSGTIPGHVSAFVLEHNSGGPNAAVSDGASTGAVTARDVVSRH